jgi:hypothetical protein
VRYGAERQVARQAVLAAQREGKAGNESAIFTRAGRVQALE